MTAYDTTYLSYLCVELPNSTKKILSEFVQKLPRWVSVTTGSGWEKTRWSMQMEDFVTKDKEERDNKLSY